MMIDRELHEVALRDSAELVPDRSATNRVRGRVQAHIQDESTPQGAEPMTRSARPKARRARFVGVSGALAGAATVILVVALGPGDSDSGRAHLPAPATAQAALEQAANAAGAAPWTPLVDGEYHHVYQTDFVPNIAPRPNDDARSIASFFHFGPPSASEMWLDRSGNGLQIRIEGGTGNPQKFPTAVKTTGGGFGYGGSVSERADVVSDELSLRYPDVVTVTSSHDPRKTTFTGWLRTHDGFVAKSRQSGAVYVLPGERPGESRQLSSWGATASQLARLDNASPENQTREIVGLLDAHAKDRNRTGMTFLMGQYGSTKKDLDREERITQAVKLLGSAPLSPDSREALFQWLAAQPGAKLNGDATDNIGRRGTRVTFETEYVKNLPAESVTTRELIREAAARGVRGTQVGPDRTYRLNARREYRRWLVTFVFDRATGELLEQTTYARYGATDKEPLVVENGAGGVKVVIQPGNRSGWLGSLDNQLFVARERAGSIEPEAAVCTDAPQVCR